MAKTLSQRMADLELWKSGHVTDPHAHGHPHPGTPPPPPPPVDPPPPPPPPPPPTTGTTRTVKSIAELKAALPDNTIDKLIGQPGATWAIDNPTSDSANSLWIDDKYRRTRPVIVDLSGVVLDGHGGTHGGLTFLDGACNQDWLAPTFANLLINQTGVITIAGYAGLPGPHHFSVRKPKALRSVKRVSPDHTTDHFIYFSHATGDWGDILIEDPDVDATDAMGLATAIHGDHGDATNVTARRVTIRRTVFRGNGSQGAAVQEPLILWQPPYHDWLFDGGTITNTNGPAIRFESISASNIVFKDITSTNSRQGGFISSYIPGGPYSVASPPPGVTFTGCSLA